MSPRARNLLGGAATVIVLAVVIVGLWAFTSPKKPALPATIQLSPAQESQQAYQQGMSALSSDDTRTALALFKKAVTLDPKNTDAKTALDNAIKATSATSGQPPATSSEPPATSATKPPPAAGATAAAVTSPVWTTKLATKTLLPKSFPDYLLGSVDAAGSDAVVAGSPKKSNSPVTAIVWNVHDRATPSAAAEFVAKVTKPLYSKSPTTVTVNGVPGYFGTDGVRFATVTFTRGRYVFEVVLTSTTPTGIQGLAEQAAAAFPTTP